MESSTLTRPETRAPDAARRAPAAGVGKVEGRILPPYPENEPVFDYEPGSPERDDLKAALDEMRQREIEIPLVIGGEEVRTGETEPVVMPHDHGHVLARCQRAGRAEAEAAVEAATEAWQAWSNWDWQDRAAVFLRAAELLSGPWRARVNAATMLGQSKTAHQAEIDSACELIDFWRFNAWFASRIYDEQPESAPGVWNRLDHRPLEGFVYAINPFNFTAIGGNLPTAPALMGNVVIWKPATTSVLSSWYVMRVLREAGLPAGVINFLPGDSRAISDVLLHHPDLAGIHFTGSTSTFQLLWKTIAENLDRYRAYPRLVGETGGKDFVVAHPTADPKALAVAIVRGGYEYQGQKCSAASRLFIPESLWEPVRNHVVEMLEDVRMGDPADFRNFMGAVIDRASFENIVSYIEHARDAEDCEIVAGGGHDDSNGWFIEPTLVRTTDPRSKLMVEEIFGPVVTAYVYPDDEWSETLRVVDEAAPYALTGAVFARDRDAIREATGVLRQAAGNFYINDKPTGAVVGQQPFGGGRVSGTNDKAGSILNLLRWVSPRAIKETFVPPTDYRYPFMDAK